ncbi:uncharacterized protein LOC124633488 [Helicoverpa zea]|uniref:uncharacterized protein LOC124633488 n=1 Tax=Helicoverpa zea TaxID=7113 RepID=UPI001F57C354|nr:uncharacterized protein LOC124633488 [Helicoverpa zea]
MEGLKVYAVLLSVVAAALACDLRESAEDIARKTAVEKYINDTRPTVLANQKYRLQYHVAPPVGWMNDPNGFSYFKDNYHLFYQFYPFDTSTGRIHWGHVISKDLVTWEQLPVALVPEEEQCFSGSAIEKEGTLVLMYTAHKNISGVVNESQYLAFSNDGVVFNKYVKNPVISFTPDNSPDFRDPKVWKYGEYYYVVTGSQTSDKKGRVILYRSKDLGFWEYVSEIGKSNGDLGLMWECPDFFELNGSFVLLMSPQGIENKTTDRYQNQFQTGYIIGSFDHSSGKFQERVPFQEIDYGHDFYATQTMEHEGHRYLIAWMGTWNADYPERAHGWAGAMTIIRELTLKGNRILMNPIDAITNLRGSKAHNGTLEPEGIIALNKTGELILNVNLTQDLTLNIKGEADESLVVLKWDTATQKVVLDRKGVVRQGEWIPTSSSTAWRIFLDASSIEVFCGEGEMVFSSRVYPVVFLCLIAIVLSKTVRHNDAISELEAYIEEKKAEINPRYRLQYHVAPPVGWMNDPNGFSYYKGEYHLFYQFYPYDSQWGPMHWGHVASPNLVDWRQLPTALIPEDEMCFSGSAIVKDDELVLMYTGRLVTAEEPYFNETQFLAFSDDGVKFHKYEGNPVLGSAPNGSPDFRDPKVWKHGDHWYVVIGSKTSDEKGRVLLYRSLDMYNWEFLSVIGESTGEMGYMWECPDFFELKGKHILLFSPQGMVPQGDRYKNTHQTGYIIGSFNYETFEFIPEVSFQEIDFGHDFYATQTTEHDGKRYLIAWFGMWEVPYPEDVDGWAGAMTIFRELKLVGNRLLMKPVETMTSLREDTVFEGKLAENVAIQFDKTGELLVNGDLSQKIDLEIKGSDGGGQVSLRWDPEVRKVVVDREGDIRQVEWLPLGSEQWRIFLDASSLELFCGEGEVVFSSRVYPDGEWKVTNLSPQTLDVVAYKLRRSVPE